MKKYNLDKKQEEEEEKEDAEKEEVDIFPNLDATVYCGPLFCIWINKMSDRKITT